MAGMDISIQDRVRNILTYLPLRRRVIDLAAIFHESTIKELQCIYPIIIDNIFGVSIASVGWNLRQISKFENYSDFEAILNFLSPHGPLFDVAYRLLGDVYLKFDYNVTHLPSAFRTLLEQRNVPHFYMEKLNLDPVTMQPVSLLLNSFELYMFRFAFELVSPWKHRGTDRAEHSGSETAYLHLAEIYLTHFLPIMTSSVQPEVFAHQASRRSPPPQVQPTRVSKLFKASALKNILADSVSPVVSQSHADIWRTETLLHIVIYFWLYVNEQPRPFLPQRQASPNSSPYSGGYSPGYNNWEVLESRASSDHLRVVRNLIKHMHYFANNLRNDGTSMDELRRSIRNILQRPLCSFLRHNIRHWPLDASFLLMLETYLSYIQPWRYLRYNPTTAAGQSSRVDAKWVSFISENLEIYTVVISEIISRFARMDLSSPRHAHMVYRLAKVLQEPDLPELLYQADLVAQSRGDADSHTALFTTATERQVLQLLRNMRVTEQLVSEQEKLAQEKVPTFWQTAQELLVGASNEDYTSSERQSTIAYLNHSSKWLSTVFGVEVPDAPNESQSQMSPGVQPSLLDPAMARKQAGLFKYGGNPDLQPIRSTECAWLVRELHKLSLAINQIHGEYFAELWNRTDFTGRLARQLPILAPPCHVHYFHKTGPGNPAPRVTTYLPARICLRPLASHRVIFFFMLVAFLPYLTGYSGPLVYIGCVLMVSLVLVIKAYLSYWFGKTPEPFIPPDISFNQ